MSGRLGLATVRSPHQMASAGFLPKAKTRGILTLRFTTTLTLTLLCAAAVSGMANANPSQLPVIMASDPGQVVPLLTKAIAGGRCWAVDAEDGKGGLVAGGSSAVLPAGRYRVHVAVARSPLGDVYSNAVVTQIQAGDASVAPPILTFEVPGEFVDIPVTATLKSPGPLAVKVSWSLDPLAGMMKKPVNLKTLDPDQPAPAAGAQMPDVADDGSIAIADLPKIPIAVAVRGAVIEPLPPIEARVETDKLTYHHGEQGVATVTLTNDADAPKSASLACAIVSGVNTETALSTQIVDLAPGGVKTVQIPFDTTSLQWGAEVRATVKMADGVAEHTGAVIAVHDNFWALAMLAAQSTDGGRSFKDPKVAAARVAQWRKSGETGFEMFFWAPDDFGDFNPKTEDYISGQTEYEESISGTKNLIEAAHKNGMAATVYSNLWGTDGQSGYKLMREHPDWFAWAGQGAVWLELWDRSTANQGPHFEKWCETGLLSDTGDIGTAIITHHANELVASHRTFGWDAVRYDSYDSNPWVVWATKLTRTLVEKQEPSFRFGYNTFPINDASRGAMDTMISGGGMDMVEYIRPTRMPLLANYMAEIAKCRDLVWAHGGNLGPINMNQPGPAYALDGMYMGAAILAAGGHAYYNPLESEMGHHAQFALRYSEMIWDNGLLPVKDPDSVVSFGGGAKPMLWETLARTREVNGHYRLVLHVINAPPDYQFFKDVTLKIPPPLRSIPLSLNLPEGAKVLSVADLSPVRGLEPTLLTPAVAGTMVNVTIPEVRFYDVIVVDFTAAKGLS